MFDEFGDDDDESQPEEQLQTFNTNTRIIHWTPNTPIIRPVAETCQ
jgi:hypothetical protein